MDLLFFKLADINSYLEIRAMVLTTTIIIFYSRIILRSRKLVPLERYVQMANGKWLSVDIVPHRQSPLDPRSPIHQLLHQNLSRPSGGS